MNVRLSATSSKRPCAAGWRAAGRARAGRSCRRRPTGRAPGRRSSAGSRPPRTCSGVSTARSSAARSRRTPAFGADRVGVGAHDLRLDRPARDPAVGGRQALDGLNRIDQATQPHQPRPAPGQLQVALRRGRELLERVAGGEHEARRSARRGGRPATGPPRRRCRWRRSRRPGARAPRGSRRRSGRGPGSERSTFGAQRVRVRAQRQVGRDAAVLAARPGTTFRHRSPLTPTPWTKTSGRPSPLSR